MERAALRLEMEFALAHLVCFSFQHCILPFEHSTFDFTLCLHIMIALCALSNLLVEIAIYNFDLFHSAVVCITVSVFEPLCT